MATICQSCGDSIGAFSTKIKIKDGYICSNCWKRLGLNSSTYVRNYDKTQIAKILARRDENQQKLSTFVANKKIGCISFNDNEKSMVISLRNRDNFYSYDQLVSFELLQNGDSITKGGVGRAVAGGILFGGVGAIVGGVTGGKKTTAFCDSLQLKITFKHSDTPIVYIPLISSRVPTNSFEYKKAFRLAQDTLSALQIATSIASNEMSNQSQADVQISVPDEIRKYKELFDEGIITEEEFNTKKKQLMNI